MRLKNKICLITGSSKGIGASFAEGFAKEGAKVIITYNKNRALAKKISSRIKALDYYKLDVSNSKNVSKVFSLIKKKFGNIDVLVNNAGINITNDFKNLKEKDWNKVIDVNLKGVFLCCQNAINIINDGGSIINIGSLSGEYGGPRTPSYAAAKAGVMSLTHCLARYLGERKINVNCLSPGVIGNDFTQKTMAPSVKKLVKNQLLIPRLGEFKDLVGCAIFLASEESSYLTAQTISINGGAWVR